MIFLEIKLLYLFLLKDLVNELLQKDLEKQEKGFKAKTGFCSPHVLCKNASLLALPVSVSLSDRIFRMIANYNGTASKSGSRPEMENEVFSLFAPSADFASFQNNYFINVFFGRLFFDGYFVSSTFCFSYNII